MFQGRTNQVFTPAGLTDPFNMLTGIDQGEIIFPLLWIIFYDPLLSKIRKSDLEYRISAKEYIDIYENISREKKLIFLGCGYMDDTSFLANNQLGMEKILEIADSFYCLNDIKINKTKLALLLRLKEKKKLNNDIKMKFGKEEITITPVKVTESERFLGVWINMYGKDKHIKNQIKREVLSINKALSIKKGLTDKMMIYLFNYLIIPIVEYRSQLVVLEKKTLEKLMAPFRKLLKNKLKMAYTVPNAILETNYIYNLNNFYTNQLQAKITNFILQINDKDVLGEIMDIHFTNVQNLLLLTNNPVYDIDNNTGHVIKKYYKNGFLMNNLLLLKGNNFTIGIDKSIKKDFHIEGGPTTIRQILSESAYVENFRFLQDHNIRFVDQITSPSKHFLLSIRELEEKHFSRLNGKSRISVSIKKYD